MPGNRDWSNVSFTPNGCNAVEFGVVRINFPSMESLFGDEGVTHPDDISGPVYIRIQSSSIGAIPAFLIGTIGVFSGRHDETDITFVTTNAKVFESKAGDLLLEAESLDGMTSPAAFLIET